MRNEGSVLMLQFQSEIFRCLLFLCCIKTILRVEENITESIHCVSRHKKNIGNTLIA